MAKKNSALNLQEKIKYEGKFWLVPVEDVMNFFDEKFPNEDEMDPLCEIDGEWFFFTGLKITKSGKDCEIVLRLGKDFKPEELDTLEPLEDFDDDDFDDDK